MITMRRRLTLYLFTCTDFGVWNIGRCMCDSPVTQPTHFPFRCSLLCAHHAVAPSVPPSCYRTMVASHHVHHIPSALLDPHIAYSLFLLYPTLLSTSIQVGHGLHGNFAPIFLVIPIRCIPCTFCRKSRSVEATVGEIHIDIARHICENARALI